MRNEDIKKIALANGFKEKEQPDGSVDLNPYVYDFARVLLGRAVRDGRERHLALASSVSTKNQNIINKLIHEEVLMPR